MRIAMCASEVVPFAKTGGLADVVGALATALDKKGEEVIVVMPFYREAKKSGINPSIALGVDGERSRTIKTKKLKKDIYTATIGKNVKVYLIEKDEYFDRPYLYSEKTGDYPDNLERFSFYCRRTLELLKEIDFKPDIIHVHDWHASLIPVYLKTIFSGDRFYKDTKTVLTVHNLGYQGIFDKEKFPKIGLDWNMFTIRGLEYFDRINLLKAGLLFADIINTVSPTYSKEIQGEELGFGLEGVLRERNTSLFGILNGVDYSVWDPRTDKYIAKNYSAESLQGKAACKEDLEDICKLPHKKEIPIIGIVSRLASQKGFDILSEAVDEICRMQLQLVILGVGEEKYQMILKRAAGKYRKRISLHLEFNDPLAHKIYAGSDIFIMPSLYEPCGLDQLIAFRYATLPLVHKTGGLADTVNKNNGFLFEDYCKEDLVRQIKEALKAFKNKKKWLAMVKKAMEQDFSWGESAKKYLQLYAKAKEN